jgi:hypothetical protein
VAQDDAEQAEKKRKEKARLEKEQAEAAVKAAQEVERLKIKVKQALARAAKLREMNQDDTAAEADSWPAEDQASVWIAPQKTKANGARRAAMYQYGNASLMTPTEELGQHMGPGVLLYFHLLSMLFWYFVLATLLTLPVVLINMEGRGIDSAAAKSWVAMFVPTMLGNQGVAVCMPPTPPVSDATNITVSDECMFCLERPEFVGCGNSTQEVCSGLNPPDICMQYKNATNATTGLPMPPYYPAVNQTMVKVPIVGEAESSTVAIIIMLCDLAATLLFLKAVGMYEVHIDRWVYSV